MITRMEAIAAQTSHASRRPQLRIGAPLRGIAAYLLAIAALFAGIGVLFLIRRAGFLAIGPRVHDALPLQQLAGTDAQPLMHMVIAWVPAGFAAGVALMALTRLGAAARVISLTVLAAAVLLFAGGLSDSISVNDPLSPHLAPQLHRDGTWIAVALFGLGALGAGFTASPPDRGHERPGRPYPNVNA